MNGKSCRVIISMHKPIVFTDNWPSKPDKDKALEWLAHRLEEGAYDNYFTVTVTEAGHPIPKRAGEP